MRRMYGVVGIVLATSLVWARRRSVTHLAAVVNAPSLPSSPSSSPDDVHLKDLWSTATSGFRLPSGAAYVFDATVALQDASVVVHALPPGENYWRRVHQLIAKMSENATHVAVSPPGSCPRWTHGRTYCA